MSTCSHDLRAVLATITLRKPEEAEEIARLILQSHNTARVFAFHGELGAGKTTLIKAFCNVLGVTDRTSSPSFAIVNEYRTGSGDPLYHFDLYRLKAAEELEGIGFDQYLNSGAFCFIEWPELASAHLAQDVLNVWIEAAASGVRTVRLD